MRHDDADKLSDYRTLTQKTWKIKLGAFFSVAVVGGRF